MREDNKKEVLKCPDCKGILINIVPKYGIRRMRAECKKCKRQFFIKPKQKYYNAVTY